MHLMPKRLLQTLLSATCLLASGLVAAQTYPAKPVTLVVPFAAGGPTDIVARTLAASMGKSLGQTVLVENKVGAGGTLAGAHVAKANPDGYTVLIHHNGMSTAPALYRKMAFNPLTDFEYVSQVVDVPMTLLGRKDLPAKNLQELSTYVKANAKSINLANAGLGAVSHLCGMLFQQAMGVDLTTVPFSGTAPAMNALLGGQVDLLCDQTTQTTQHIKAGTVRMYGVTTKRPQGFRSHRLARHVCPQRHACGRGRQIERGSARQLEGPRLCGPHGRSGRRDRSGVQAIARRPAQLAAV
jgi:tripartite-type tricarboxylate transporter receptor subunit TctC